MAKKIKLKTDYDHEWPSRAVTAFKAGRTYTVKDEVAAAAEKKGVLDGKPVDVAAKAATPPADPPKK